MIASSNIITSFLVSHINPVYAFDGSVMGQSTTPGSWKFNAPVMFALERRVTLIAFTGHLCSPPMSARKCDILLRQPS
jgi:hypothetical protein